MSDEINNAEKTLEDQEIFVEGIEFGIPVDAPGKISLSTLRSYISKIDSLTYEDKHGKAHAVKIDNGTLYGLQKCVKKYKPWVLPAAVNDVMNICNSRKQKVDHIINRFKGIRDKENDEKAGKKEKASSENQPNNFKKLKLDSTNSMKVHKTRDLNIGWFHKKRSQYSPACKSKHLKLEIYKEYSAEEIKNLIIEKCISDDDNNFEVNLKQCAVVLGFYDKSTIDTFVDENGKECGLWEYLKARNISWRTTLYILSTYAPVEVSLQTASKSDDNISTKVSHLIEKELLDGDSNAEATAIDVSNFAEPNNKVTEIVEAELVPDNAKNCDLIVDLEVLPSDLQVNDIANLPIICSNVDIRYEFIIISKYSKEAVIMNLNKQDLYNHLSSSDEEFLLSYEEFNPYEAGFKISETVINEKTLLQITRVENEKGSSILKYEFPSYDKEIKPHSILHDTTEVYGICDGLTGLGLITSCSSVCKPIFSWYKNKELFKKGPFLYWINVDENDRNIAWHCEITCNQMLSKLPLDEKQDLSTYIKQKSLPLIKKEQLEISKTVIGAGAQGKVFQGKYCGKDVAIKTINIASSDISTILQEIAVLEYVRFPSIILTLGLNVQERKLRIVMELFPSNTLYDILFDEDVKEEFPLDKLKKSSIAFQIASATSYLHTQDVPIIHRDLKPENILVNHEFVVKLCDLSLSKFVKEYSAMRTTIGKNLGTSHYQAPEILLYGSKASTSTDIWAMGCIFFETYLENFIWGNIKNEEDLKVLLTSDVYLPDLSKLEGDIETLIKKCLNKNPKERPKANDIVKIYENLQN